MREHALFALRNALEGNPENQAVVKEMQPVAYWNDEGVLSDLPSKGLGLKK
jgi:ataxin-10